jgi:hypothetical protein
MDLGVRMSAASTFRESNKKSFPEGNVTVNRAQQANKVVQLLVTENCENLTSRERIESEQGFAATE